jgi:hypothetical protein
VRVIDWLGRPRLQRWAISLGIGLVLALLGPFGSYAMPLGDRLLIWMATCLAAAEICRSAMLLSLATWRGLPWPLAAAIGLTLAVLPLGAVVALAVGLVTGRWFGHSGSLLALAGQVWLLTLLIGLGWAFIVQRLRPHPAPAVAAGTGTGRRPSPFLDRLPAHLGRELVCLAMEDHYVRAHTSEGSTLILMRLRDAIAELGGVAGRQVHRSYWVAEGAILRIERRGDTRRLRLKNGLEVPVSRRHLPALRAAGWLDGESMGIA